MFDQTSQSTGTSYTGTAGLLIAGVLFVPTVLLFAAPVTRSALYWAIAFSVAILGLAWANWRRNSRLSIPTINRRA